MKIGASCLPTRVATLTTLQPPSSGSIQRAFILNLLVAITNHLADARSKLASLPTKSSGDAATHDLLTVSADATIAATCRHLTHVVRQANDLAQRQVE
jgi:hypothetical protein